jgi:hypothetical protein
MAGSREAQSGSARRGPTIPRRTGARTRVRQLAESMLASGIR